MSKASETKAAEAKAEAKADAKAAADNKANTNTETVHGEPNKQLANVTQPSTTEQLQEAERRRVEEIKLREADEKDRAARQDAQEKERIQNAIDATKNMTQSEFAARMIAADDGSKPYGHPDPAPGAAGYEPPKLNPEPGSVEYMLAHPGEITTGTITRDNPGEMKSHADIRAEKDASEKAA